jgi:hypothetical protein
MDLLVEVFVRLRHANTRNNPLIFSVIFFQGSQTLRRRPPGKAKFLPLVPSDLGLPTGHPSWPTRRGRTSEVGAQSADRYRSSRRAGPPRQPTLQAARALWTLQDF